MQPLAIIVLAAGLGKRMGQDLPKVTSRTHEKTLIEHVIKTASTLNPEKVVIVTGYKREVVEGTLTESRDFSYLKDRTTFCFQEEQRGTGHAVQCALPALDGFNGAVIILYGDVPLLKEETLKDLATRHHQQKATLSLISLKGDYNNKYGRIIRGADLHVKKIVEFKDCSPEELLIDETNSGIYVVDSAFLRPAVKSLNNENAQNEYYLTDIVEKSVNEGQTIHVVPCFDAMEVQGVNTREDLALINRELGRRRISDFMQQGVVFTDSASVFIGPEVTIAAGAEIGPQVQLLGSTAIGKNVKIEGCAYLLDSKVAAHVTVKFGVRAEGAVIGEEAMVGPFAHLRPGAELHAEVKVGNFVEIKKALLKKGAKASHLTYLGDCEVGEDANIGAGTITCNYDGYRKFKTEIGAGAFIGSNTSLVAPVKIGAGAIVGAGSAITKDVTADDLALTRAEQRVVKGWAKKKRDKEAANKKS